MGHPDLESDEVCYSPHVHVPDATPTVPPIWGIFMYHWLVISIFALFNVLLWWVYRKRGKEIGADE